MKKFKVLALVLAFTLCFCNLGITYVSAASIIDISEQTDPFPLYISGNNYSNSPHDYYPYIISSGSADLNVRMYNYDNQTIRVRLFDRTTGMSVGEQTTNSYRSILYFGDLNGNHVYYFRFYNEGNALAELDVEIL